MLSYLYTHLETDTTEQLQKVISNYQDFVANIVQKPNMGNKELKGYQFDSLVYRYIRARENMARYEYRIDSNSFKYKNVDFIKYQDRAQRDIVRFIEILNEVIGEHS